MHRRLARKAVESDEPMACRCSICLTTEGEAGFEPQYGLNAADRGEAGPNGKPSYTIGEAAAQLTRNNTTWNGAGVLGQPATVTYAFRDTAPATMPGETVGFTPFTAAQIVQAERSLQSWADVANIVFQRVGTGTGAGAYSEDAQMLFAAYQSGGSGAAFAYSPGGGNASAGGDSWYRVAYVEGAANLNYNRQVLTHEIGHAIGISHPGSYNAGNGSPTYANDAVYYEDSRQYSVMSYWSATNTGANLGGQHSAAPLLDDIAAAQRLYGANMATRTGDTVYGFNSNTGRDFYTTTGAALIFAAWDAGGTDTFDFSGYAQAQRIDLRAGNFSDVGGLIGNVAIAAGVVIENALGGAGADVITGNAAANRLTGGGGRDRLTGGAGADVFAYVSVADSAPEAATRDVVTDFTIGQDRFDLLLAGGLRFIGAAIFAGLAGEVRSVIADALTLVELDRDGDRAADLQIELLGALVLTGAEFVGMSVWTTGTAGADTLTGTAGLDMIDGLAGNDLLDLSAGGDDQVLGGDGNDTLLFGSTLTAGDRVDGGAGSDVLAVQGNYALTFGAASLVGVETLTPLSGSDVRFGDTGNNRYAYALTTVDANVAAGQRLVVNAAQLLAGETLTLDGSAETDGGFFLYGGQGADLLIGGAGADVFFLAEGRFNVGDRFAGNAGADIVVLRGSVTATFAAATFTGIETVTLMSASDNRFFTGGTSNSYAITSHDGNVATGAVLTVNGGALKPGETMAFDGRAELDGAFRLFGGASADTLRGGAGTDLIYGGLGGDTLSGGAGADIFRFQSTAESTGTARDILDFGAGDRIDLSRIDADTATAGDEAFSFIGAAAFTGTAGQLRASVVGDLTTLEADTNGDGIADLSILLPAAPPLTSADFVL